MMTTKIYDPTKTVACNNFGGTLFSHLQSFAHIACHSPALTGLVLLPHRFEFSPSLPRGEIVSRPRVS